MASEWQGWISRLRHTWVTEHHHVGPDHTYKPRHTQDHQAYLGLHVKIKCMVVQVPSGRLQTP